MKWCLLTCADSDSSAHAQKYYTGLFSLLINPEISKAVVPVLVLLFVALCFEAICCMSFRVSFCSCVFQSF